MVDAGAIISYNVIAVVSATRAVQIGKATVSGIYQRRAILMALVSMSVVASNIVTYLPYPNAFVSLLAIQLIHVVEITIAVRLVDWMATVAVESDFFHRDHLHWLRLRKWVYLAYAAIVVAYFFEFYFISPPAGSPLLLPTGLGLFPILGYLVAVLFVGARRTPDTNLKRNVILLGASILFVISAIPFVRDVIAPTGGLPLIGNILFVGWSYVYYRAVMALSPVGHVRASEVSGAEGGPLGSSESKAK